MTQCPKCGHTFDSDHSVDRFCSMCGYDRTELNTPPTITKGRDGVSTAASTVGCDETIVNESIGFEIDDDVELASHTTADNGATADATSDSDQTIDGDSAVSLLDHQLDDSHPVDRSEQAGAADASEPREDAEFDFVVDSSVEIDDNDASSGAPPTVAADDPTLPHNAAGATADMTLQGDTRASAKTVAIPKPRVVTRSDELVDTRTDYTLLEQVGEGGMGTIYRARQLSIQRDVAFKEIKAKNADKSRHRNNFSAEAAITGSLDHPNIVPIYELGATSDGTLFYSMKLVEGNAWDDLLPTLSLADNLEILQKVCDAVAFAHSRGVIHRDLKPENVMIGGFGEVLVMDWGLAIAIAPEGVYSPGGSPAYMAPEMALHYLHCQKMLERAPRFPLGFHSDIYLLGAILFEILAKYPPHASKSALEGLRRAARNERVASDHQSELMDIAVRAMATVPARRHQSVQEFQQALRAYQLHAQSIQLSDKAQQHLSEACENHEYPSYTRALNGFQDALELWDGNHAARDGLQVTHHEYARSALQRGDYQLGMTLLNRDDPEDAPLYSELVQARDARNRRMRATRRLTRLAFILVALLVVGSATAAWWFQRLRSEAVAQRIVAEEAKRVEEQERILAEQARAAAVDARQHAEAERQRAILAREAEAKERKRAEDARLAEMASRRKAEQAEQQERIAHSRAAAERYRASIGLVTSLLKEQAFTRAADELDALPHEAFEWSFLHQQIVRNHRDLQLDNPEPRVVGFTAAANTGRCVALLDGDGQRQWSVWSPPGWGIDGWPAPPRHMIPADRCMSTSADWTSLDPSGRCLATADRHTARVHIFDLHENHSDTIAIGGNASVIHLVDARNLLVGAIRSDGGAITQQWQRDGDDSNWRLSREIAHNTRPVRWLASDNGVGIAMCDHFLYQFRLALDDSGTTDPAEQTYRLAASASDQGWISCGHVANGTMWLGTRDGLLYSLPVMARDSQRHGPVHLRGEEHDGQRVLVTTATGMHAESPERQVVSRSLIDLQSEVTAIAVATGCQHIIAGHRDGYVTFLGKDFSVQRRLRLHLHDIREAVFVPRSSTQAADNEAPLLLTTTERGMAVTDPRWVTSRSRGILPYMTTQVDRSDSVPSIYDAVVLNPTRRLATVDEAGRLRLWHETGVGTYTLAATSHVGHDTGNGDGCLPRASLYRSAKGDPQLLTSTNQSLVTWDVWSGSMTGRRTSRDTPQISRWQWGPGREQLWLRPVDQQGLILGRDHLTEVARFSIDFTPGDANLNFQVLDRDSLIMPINAGIRVLRRSAEVANHFATSMWLQDRGFRSTSRSMASVFVHPLVGLADVAISNGEETVWWNFEDDSPSHTEASRKGDASLGESIPFTTALLQEEAISGGSPPRWLARNTDLAERPTVRFHLIEFDTVSHVWRSSADALPADTIAVSFLEDNTLVRLVQGETHFAMHERSLGETPATAETVAPLIGLPQFAGIKQGDLRLSVDQGMNLASSRPAVVVLLCEDRTLESQESVTFHAGDGWLALYDETTESWQVTESYLSRRPLRQVAWSESEQLLITVSDSGHRMVWPITSDEQPSLPHRAEEATDPTTTGTKTETLLTVHRNQTTATYNDTSQQIVLRDTTIRHKRSESIATHNVAIPATAMAFAPSGDRLIVGYRDGRVEVFRITVASMEPTDRSSIGLSELFSFVAHRSAIRTIRFTDDADQFITTSDDGTASLWLAR